jgi:hypothetical protein
MVKVLLALGVLCSSCSLALMETEDDGLDVVHRAPHCTGTKGFAAMDALYAVTDVGAPLFVSQYQDVSIAYFIVPVAVAAVHLGSALYGIKAADRCQELRRHRDVVDSNIADRIQVLSKAEIDRERAAKKAPAAPAVVPDAGVPIDGGINDAGPAR